MEINLKITLESTYNESTDSNEVQIKTDTYNSVNEVLTILRLEQNNLMEAIKIAHDRDKPTEVDDWLKNLKMKDLYGA